MERKEELGLRKVVYKEGDQVRAITGDCVFEGDFLKVTNDRGEILINKNNVLVIKNPGEVRG